MIKIEHFNVRIVRQGDKYGRGDCRTHESDKPTVEFYDSRYDHADWMGRGQFVSRYYASTLAGHKGGLNLHGGVEGWVVSDEGMQQVLEYLRAELGELPAEENIWCW